MHTWYVQKQNKKYINGLMMSVPSLYKAIFASEMEDEVMNAFCSNNTSDVILYNRFKVKDS